MRSAASGEMTSVLKGFETGVLSQSAERIPENREIDSPSYPVDAWYWSEG
jgi:hypothetical protein